MYSGGFYPFQSPNEFWAYWSHYVYINRYQPAPLPSYQKFVELLEDKNYFVITTNVDHQFQQAGCSKERLFYPQGNFGLWQCSLPCHHKIYDNKEQIELMLKNQDFTIGDKNLEIPDKSSLKREISSYLIPHCQKRSTP